MARTLSRTLSVEAAFTVRLRLDLMQAMLCITEIPRCSY